MRLVAVDQCAHAIGLRPGLTLADARARVPELAAHDHDPHADRQWLGRLADGCLRFTPRVALDPPDGLILDITGCAHLFGGEAGMAGDLAARLARLGMSTTHAFAATPDAARALARFRSAPAAAEEEEEEAIRQLPVHALRLADRHATGLVRAGLKTVGEIARRPMAAIAARFGAETVTSLRRMLGEEECALTPHRVPPGLLVQRRFAEPIARSDYALQVLGELAGEAAVRLEADGDGGRRFEAMFFRSDGLVRTLRIETGRPVRDAAAVMRLFRERIETLDDPLDPGFGYDLLRLAVPLVEPLAPAQLKLEGGAVAEAEIASLIDRLTTRLGRNRVRRFVPADSHMPERAELALPAMDTPAPKPWDKPEPGEPPLRPLHLFDPPQLVEVMAEVPDGPPMRFRWRQKLHEVARSEGPERLAPEWWRQGVKGLTRDYYRIEDVRGRRYWIFRHGLYGEECAEPRWYLHGLFA